MVNQSLPSTEDPIKENIRYSTPCGTPMVNHARYSRHLSSRCERKSLNGRFQTIIHVTIRPPKNNFSPKENKSEDTITDLSSTSANETNNSDITPNLATQAQSATYSLDVDETSPSPQLLPQTHEKSFTNEHNDATILQTNHSSTKTSRIFKHSNSNVFGNNNETTKKEDWCSNIRDLHENSGKKKKKKCPSVLNCRCSWVPVCLLTALLLGLAIAAVLLAILIKPRTTTSTSEIATITDTTQTTATLTTTTQTTTATTTTTTSTTESTTKTTTTTLTTSTSLPTTTNVTVSATTSNWFGQEEITVNCLTTLKNITIQIFVRRTVGATYGGAYNTFWGGTLIQSYTTNSTHIIHTWTIVSGQTILCSSGPYKVVAQFGLTGTAQITSADTYIVTTTTSAGVTTTLSGNF